MEIYFKLQHVRSFLMRIIKLSILRSEKYDFTFQRLLDEFDRRVSDFREQRDKEILSKVI